jgi:hypothetical protein
MSAPTTLVLANQEIHFPDGLDYELRADGVLVVYTETATRLYAPGQWLAVTDSK